MRSLLLAALVLLSVSVPAALAGSSKRPKVNCTLTADKGDRVVQGETLVISKGERVESAVAIDGDVVVKSGATVKSAVAVNGHVVLEPGAKVLEDAVAIGGDLKVSDGSSVGKDAVTIGGELKAGRASSIRGDTVSLAFGGTMVQDIIDSVLERTGKCVITQK